MGGSFQGSEYGKDPRSHSKKILEIADHIWARKSEEHRATEILRILRTKKFMLMIDEIWERIDLVNIGIPLPDHQMSPK